MMSEFLRPFLTPSLPLVRILFTDPLLVKSEFHEPPPSPKFGHHLWMFPQVLAPTLSKTAPMLTRALPKKYPCRGYFLVVYKVFTLCFFYYSLAQRVSELLDSFRPGSISYRPFKKQAKETWIIDSNNNNHDVEPVRHPQPLERVIGIECC